MTKLDVYDPAMCCSTGVCGPTVDPVLPRVAADLDWLRRRGVEVARHNLAQQPAAFAANPTVTGALREFGNACLPLVLVDGQVAVRGRYPGRDELARLVGLDAPADATEAAPKSCCSTTTPAGVVTIGGTPGDAPPSCC